MEFVITVQGASANSEIYILSKKIQYINVTGFKRFSYEREENSAAANVVTTRISFDHIRHYCVPSNI